jgi:hypothetical protein
MLNRGHLRARQLLFGVFFGFARVAWPQGEPLGPEFRVNTYTTESQSRPQVAADQSGRFIVVWNAYSGPFDYEIMAQRYASSGVPMGLEFRVNTFTANPQYFGVVAADASGNFVVAWNSFFQDGSYEDVFGQRYTFSGVPLGPEFRINTYTTGLQSVSSVASDPSGNFVVVWTGESDGSGTGIFGQRYASSGMPLGSEFRVNTYTTSLQTGAHAAVDADGDFIVVWNSPEAPTDWGIFAQRYSSSGAALGPQFRVNTYTTDDQFAACVGFDASGNFVIAWQSDGQEGPGRGIFGQRYASSGLPLGGEFRVNTYTTGFQSYPSIAVDGAGNFVVVWDDYGQDGSGFGVHGQRYASTGAPDGSEFRVNTYTTDWQRYQQVAADGTGNFVVVWQSTLQDGSGYGVFGQRFGPIFPVDLVQFAVE